VRKSSENCAFSVIKLALGEIARHSKLKEVVATQEMRQLS
jgi:hypothetical protein